MSRLHIQQGLQLTKSSAVICNAVAEEKWSYGYALPWFAWEGVCPEIKLAILAVWLFD